jgi:hypothetical protein
MSIESNFIDILKLGHLFQSVWLFKTLQVVGSQLVMKKRQGGFPATRCYSITYVIYVILI